jgi:hypothetical protein
MAKKKQETVAPAISTIPLPDQDSPLVIDLPDGQKLVVGNIAHGTVIEVATWRGTGRPDSRTSRLMLGVSSSNAVSNVEASAPSAEVPETKKQNSIQKFLASLVASTPKRKREKAVEAIDEIMREDLATPPSEVEQKSSSRISKALGDDEDIETWLDSLMSESSADFARVDSETLGPKTKVKASARVKRISSPRSRKKTRKGSKKPASSRSSTSKGRKPSKRGSKTSKTR